MRKQSKKINRTCVNCGEEFEVYLSRIRAGKGRFCSKKCWYESEERYLLMKYTHSGLKKPYAKPPHPKGKDHPCWRGGITPINMKIRNSIEFRLWREAVFARDNWTCRECGERGGNLHAHHIKSFSKYPKLRFAIDNGMTLCKGCHKLTDNYKSKAKNKL